MIWVAAVAAWIVVSIAIGVPIGRFLRRSREAAEAIARQQQEETKPQSILGGKSHGEAGDGH